MVAVFLAALAVINTGFAAALIVPSYVTRTVTGQIPDFAAFWAAARLAQEGSPALAYDWNSHRAVEVGGLGRDFAGWMPWHYPPPVQLMVMPLGDLALFPAMAVWLAVTGALFLWACWRILPHPAAPLAGLAAAPTALTLVNGQIGFLIAALIGLALNDLSRRPFGAGLILGLVSIKVHLVAAAPVVLIASGRWRIVAGGALGTGLLALVSWLALGGGTWEAFFASIAKTTGAFSGTGAGVQRWIMSASPFGWLRYNGIDMVPALSVQAAVALPVLWLTVRAWRAPWVSDETRAALLCFATLAVTPRLLNYDLHVLVIGALFQVRHGLRHGFAVYEHWVLAGAAIAGVLGLVMPPALTPALPLVLFLTCWQAQAAQPRA